MTETTPDFTQNTQSSPVIPAISSSGGSGYGGSSSGSGSGSGAFMSRGATKQWDNKGSKRGTSGSSDDSASKKPKN